MTQTTTQAATEFWPLEAGDELVTVDGDFVTVQAPTQDGEWIQVRTSYGDDLLHVSEVYDPSILIRQLAEIDPVLTKTVGVRRVKLAIAGRIAYFGDHTRLGDEEEFMSLHRHLCRFAGIDQDEIEEYQDAIFFPELMA